MCVFTALHIFPTGVTTCVSDNGGGSSRDPTAPRGPGVVGKGFARVYLPRIPHQSRELGRVGPAFQGRRLRLEDVGRHGAVPRRRRPGTVAASRLSRLRGRRRRRPPPTAPTPLPGTPDPDSGRLRTFTGLFALFLTARSLSFRGFSAEIFVFLLICQI